MSDDESDPSAPLGFFSTSAAPTPEETLLGMDFLPAHLVPDVDVGSRQRGTEMDVDTDKHDANGPPRKKLAVASAVSGAPTPVAAPVTSTPAFLPRPTLPDSVTRHAQNGWSGVKDKEVSGVVEEAWNAVVEVGFDRNCVGVLEVGGMVDKLLWPRLTPASSASHTLLLAVLVLDRARSGHADPFGFIRVEAAAAGKGKSKGKEDKDARMDTLFSQAVDQTVASLRASTAADAATEHVSTPVLVFLPFLSLAVAHLDVTAVRSGVQRFTGVGLWEYVSDAVRDEQVGKYAFVGKQWEKWGKRVKDADPATKSRLAHDASFLASLISTSVSLLRTPAASLPRHAHAALSHVLSFVTDILSSLPTRRYAHLLVQDSLFLEELLSSALVTKPGKDRSDPAVHLLGPLAARLVEVVHHPVGSLTGEALSDTEMRARQAVLVSKLQKRAFSDKEWKALYESVAMRGAGVIGDAVYVEKVLKEVDVGLVRVVAGCVGVRTVRLVVGEDGKMVHGEEYGKEFLARAVAGRVKAPKGVDEVVESVGVMLDETTIFSPLTTSSTFLATPAGLPTPLQLPTPKLALQYLTPTDALLRHLHLARTSAASAVRADVEDAVARVEPTADPRGGDVGFGGWARMALPVEKCRVTEVGPARVIGGDGVKDVPSYVKVDVTFSLHRSSEVVKREWDALTPRDVVILVACHPPLALVGPEPADPGQRFLRRWGIRAVRSAEISDLVDSTGALVENWSRAGGSRAMQRETDAAVPDELPADAPTAPKWKQYGEFDKSGEDERRKGLMGAQRTYRCLVDAVKYVSDVANDEEGPGGGFYGGFNLVVRRKPGENTWKAMLEAVRDMCHQGDAVLPGWLREVYLGYGEAKEVTGWGVEDPVRVLDVRDGLGKYGAVEKWAVERGYTLVPKLDALPARHRASASANHPSPPYVMSFPPSMFSGERTASNNPGRLPVTPGAKRAVAEIEGKDAGDWKESKGKKKDEGSKEVVMRTYKEPNMGPFLEDKRKKNEMDFTAAQIDAILSGVRPGLTLVVGPPGTGKTDVAVEIVRLLYHNYPGQRILLVTHSNQALNHLFEKISRLDVDPRHLLRLGHGEGDLDVEGDWGKYGRVTAFLEERERLLVEVGRIKDSLGILGEHNATCETAGYFFLYQVLSRWEPYWSKVKEAVRAARSAAGKCKLAAEAKARTAIVDGFPFSAYFSAAPEPIFPLDATLDDLVDSAAGCFRHVRRVFDALEEVRAFELLRTNYDRANYLLVKEARVVAMTCTHAALKRKELIRLGFRYESIVMEESAQITEIESLIPLALQLPDESGTSRLRRCVMIGDHHQLPPVVKDVALQRHANLEQSLFARFVRLGVPTVELDMQGRARPSIADLYRWRYTHLGDLTGVISREEFKMANPGFALEYQCVDVGDFQGKGETEPLAHFFQNLGEAEYVVAVYQYMRLLGYPAEKITILTTYNGQKELIKDVLEQRCSWNPLFGRPSRIATVDKYQGQQNDYILLSLVRTRSVGHLRDVRRLVVALSRARLGLYVFCRRRLFASCAELAPAFDKILERPDKLVVRTGERFGETKRGVAETGIGGSGGKGKGKAVEGVVEIEGTEHMGQYVYQMTQELIAFARKQRDERDKARQVDSEKGREGVEQPEVDAMEADE